MAPKKTKKFALKEYKTLQQQVGKSVNELVANLVQDHKERHEALNVSVIQFAKVYEPIMKLAQAQKQLTHDFRESLSPFKGLSFGTPFSEMFKELNVHQEALRKSLEMPSLAKSLMDMRTSFVDIERNMVNFRTAEGFTNIPELSKDEYFAEPIASLSAPHISHHDVNVNIIINPSIESEEFGSYNFHRLIYSNDECKFLFSFGRYNKAYLEAFSELEDFLREITGARGRAQKVLHVAFLVMQILYNFDKAKWFYKEACELLKYRNILSHKPSRKCNLNKNECISLLNRLSRLLYMLDNI